MSDLVVEVLCRASLPTSEYALNARRLMLKLFEACSPSSLLITGVNNSDEHPVFYRGFGDVFRPSYQGRPVALKRMRVFIGDATPRRTRLRGSRMGEPAPPFYFASPRNRKPYFPVHILPDIAMDEKRYSLGIAQGVPSRRGGSLKGLNYLHSINIVHGDIRGNSILISDDFSVCLTDFGLANIIFDSQTTAATNTNHAGSKW
ncbi:hypothetical protein DFH09DRAFT_1477888 [Mycena vulgaris]|nr:hypothetical protein DFH09DRAFT_1477888 [Mycena vulgaris]